MGRAPFKPGGGGSSPPPPLATPGGAEFLEALKRAGEGPPPAPCAELLKGALRMDQTRCVPWKGHHMMAMTSARLQKWAGLHNGDRCQCAWVPPRDAQSRPHGIYMLFGAVPAHSAASRKCCGDQAAQRP